MTRVLVLELLGSGPSGSAYEAAVKRPNFYGVMGTSVAAWARRCGADVTFRTATGDEAPRELLAGAFDVAFVASSTATAWTAYAASRLLRQRGAITALGGPHAHAYPADSAAHFDYVLGRADEALVQRVLTERGGGWLDAGANPAALPSLRERAPFVDVALARAWGIRVVPMLGSIGCPYSCDFCSDAETPYRALDFGGDLAFAAGRWPGAMLFWHDPSFGVRFDETADALEANTRGSNVKFGAESPLGLLSDERLDRLAGLGFQAMLPGIETWSDYSRKARVAGVGHPRMVRTAERVEAVAARIPYVQVNFIAGSDPQTAEDGALTREFLRRVPAAWPNINLLTAYGRIAPLSRELAEHSRILDVPFVLADQKTTTNVVTPGVDPIAVLEELLRTLEEATAPMAVARRILATRGVRSRAVHALRAWGGEQRQRMRWYRSMIAWIGSDPRARDFYAGEPVPVPERLRDEARRRLGPWAEWLPAETGAFLDGGARPEPLREHFPGYALASPRADAGLRVMPAP